MVFLVTCRWAEQVEKTGGSVIFFGSGLFMPEISLVLCHSGCDSCPLVIRCRYSFFLMKQTHSKLIHLHFIQLLSLSLLSPSSFPFSLFFIQPYLPMSQQSVHNFIHMRRPEGGGLSEQRTNVIHPFHADYDYAAASLITKLPDPLKQRTAHHPTQATLMMNESQMRERIRYDN